MWLAVSCFFFQAEDGIRDLVRSRGLGDVYKRQHDDLVAESVPILDDLVQLAAGVAAGLGDAGEDAFEFGFDLVWGHWGLTHRRAHARIAKGAKDAKKKRLGVLCLASLA